MPQRNSPSFDVIFMLAFQTTSPATCTALVLKLNWHAKDLELKQSPKRKACPNTHHASLLATSRQKPLRLSEHGMAHDMGGCDCYCCGWNAWQHRFRPRAPDRFMIVHSGRHNSSGKWTSSWFITPESQSKECPIFLILKNQQSPTNHGITKPHISHFRRSNSP